MCSLYLTHPSAHTLGAVGTVHSAVDAHTVKKKLLFYGILLFYFTVFSRIFEIQLKMVKLQK